MALDRIKQQLQDGALPLSQAIEQVRKVADDKLTSEEKQWLRNEAEGYEIDPQNDGETPPFEGFVADHAVVGDSVGLPIYRKLYGRTYSHGAWTGNWHDQSHTGFGKAPQLIPESVRHIEENILPMYESGKKPTAIYDVDGIKARRVFEKEEFENLLNGSKLRLFEIIDRLKSA